MHWLIALQTTIAGGCQIEDKAVTNFSGIGICAHYMTYDAQVAIHAIGDRAIDELLGIHKQLPIAASQPRLPHRIEHAQHLSGSNSTELLSRLGLHAITNPQHLLTDRGIMQEQLGVKRSGHGRSFAYSSMHKV